MMFKIRICASQWAHFLFFFITASFLGAQEKDPELVLPEMVLEVTSVGVEEVQALLPEAEELPLPELTLPLPEVEALDVRVVELQGFTLEYQPGKEEYSGRSRSDLFLNARMGLGSPNSLEAYFQVIKLGEFPRFRLEFEHSGLDGYWFQRAYSPPGRNQNQGMDRFLGELILEDSLFSSQSLIEIGRSEYGLQNLGAFQSIDLQGLEGFSSNSFSLGERWRWTLDARGQVRNMVLSGDNSRFHQAADLQAYGGLALNTQELSLTVQAGGELYYLYGDGSVGWENRLTPYFGSRGSLEWSLPWSLELRPQASLLWAGEEPLWHVELELERQSRAAWSFLLGSSYRQELLEVFDQWAEGVYLSTGGASDPGPQRLLQIFANLGFYFGTEAELLLGAHYDWEDNYPQVTGIDPTTGLLAWERGRVQRLSPEIALVLRPSPGLKWENTFRYHFLSLEEGRRADWDFSIEWGDREGFMGLSLDQEWSFLPSLEENFPENGDPNLPVMDAGVYFTWNESFLTRLGGSRRLGRLSRTGPPGSFDRSFTAWL
jgi:hypothetical protein